MLNGNGNYKTRNTPLAAYLITEGFELVNVETDSYPSFFVFRDTAELHQCSLKFQSGRAEGNIAVFYDNYRKCLRMAKSGLL